ncbi:MAG TPA: MFS transporter [Gammaproteobacteria bacterium]|nr:MFS transporter [Gammaproteobacteria bacterium]HIM04354.1 MFS transporter [Gammaproteobacteria bacterium]
MYLSKLRGRPELLLLMTAAAVPLSFATWQALLNNFAIERAAFGGAEMGILQSLREVPGFLAFLVVFLLFLCREQTIAYVSLLLLGVGTLVTGWFPSVVGLYVTTVAMSLGYHYFETVHSSLCLQWIDKDKAPELLGRVIAVGAFSSIVVYGFIWITFELLGIDFSLVYFLGGCATVVIGLVCWLLFQQFPVKVKQNRQMVLRRRYWLYYALTFLSGARRQIFIVFAGFLMVEKFGFDVAMISILFLVNAVLNMLFAARLGRLIGNIGERRILIFEYVGLTIVFTAYAFVSNAAIAAGLYIIDHFFFALAIAIRTYFQKIADPADIAATAGVGFTINHIAAVVLPALLGFLWLISPSAVFLVGSALAVLSMLLSFNVPENPCPGNEVVHGRWGSATDPTMDTARQN